MPHAMLRRYWAEELVRLRRADEDRRYAASQRRGRIDPNPHQIDAVMFALRRVREGGCILADEVGLGKTIEAGLVMAQLLAEGARRILLILPKPLLGQWRNELYDLFGIATREAGGDELLTGDGVFVVGREFAGSERGSSLLRAADPFNLCVIDEAHEIFAGIYKRYDRLGNYNLDSDEAVMAHRVREFLGRTPVLLLTATPIQNTLTELWALVQYVEPTGTLLGNLATFRELFCESGGDRHVNAAQAHELRRRINNVCQRTLRRQAQEFLEKRFTVRRARLFEYSMSDAERALYDDVTDYLLEPNLCAFRGNQRRLLLIGFMRQMASSLPALAASLSGVARRLRGMLEGNADSPDATAELARDLEDDELSAQEEQGTAGNDAKAPPPDRVRAEFDRVQEFIRRAQSLPGDAKAQSLLDAVRLIIERGRLGTGSGKVVIFTESLTTQDYIRKLLLDGGMGLTEGGITLFRGENDSPRAQQALERWRDEVGKDMPPGSRPSRQVAIRLALIHEFKSRSCVFISTEAGAKGLNLQFCETLVNYDLPWNPQRIEQRIGRCHRYSQTRDVTVINFLARDNEAQRLTFQILSEKLDLFGQVLDASDVVLHQPDTDAPETITTVLGADFESQLQRIYQRARSRDEITAELRKLSESIGAERMRFDEVQQHTASLIESRFDESVRQVFRQIAEKLPATLDELDREIERVVTGYLLASGIEFERREQQGRLFLTLRPAPQLPPELREGATLCVGHSREIGDAEPLYLGHPLVQAAVDESRAASARPFHVRFLPDDSPAGQTLAVYRGRRGRLVVTKATYSGFEPVEQLLTTALMEHEADPLPAHVAESLLRLVPEDVTPFDPPLDINGDDLDDAVQEGMFRNQAEIAKADQARFERLLEQIERYVEDQALVLGRQRTALEKRCQEAQHQRDTALGADARTRAENQLRELDANLNDLATRIRRLQTRDDPDYQKWREHAHGRRFAPPQTARILDVEFQIE